MCIRDRFQYGADFFKLLLCIMFRLRYDLFDDLEPQQVIRRQPHDFGGLAGAFAVLQMSIRDRFEDSPAAGSLMKAVNILCDHSLQLSRLFQLRCV